MLAGLGAWAGTVVTAKAAADPLAGAALYADVKTYAGLGEHRTGTPGDAATTEWLAKALTGAGYTVERQGFDYPVFELARAEVTLGGRTLEGFPYWTPGTSPPGGVSGALSLSGGSGKIALVVLPPGTGGGLDAPPPGQITDAVKSGAAAVVAVTDNPLGEMSVLNRNPKAAPWPVPVLLVAGREAAALKAAAGETATVRVEGRTVNRTAYNVIGRRARAGKHLVVSTPKSGWLTCAGERGAGVAIWLGLARWLAAATDHNLTVVAASGHEFDGYGAHRFIETLAPRPAETKLWLAIGANVAAYDFALQDGRIARQPGPQAGRILACSETLMPLAARAFAGQPGYATPLDVDNRKPPGELAAFQARGYSPLIGLVALHPLHHTRRDLPDVTDGAMLEPVARGLQAILQQACVRRRPAAADSFRERLRYSPEWRLTARSPRCRLPGSSHGAPHDVVYFYVPVRRCRRRPCRSRRRAGLGGRQAQRHDQPQGRRRGLRRRLQLGRRHAALPGQALSPENRRPVCRRHRGQQVHGHGHGL